MKKKCLYSKVDDMTYTTKPPMCRVLLKMLFLKEISFNCSTKGIVCARIVSDNSPKLLYNAVILKNREKSSKLHFSTMAFNWRKCKKSLCVLLFNTINKICNYC